MLDGFLERAISTFLCLICLRFLCGFDEALGLLRIVFRTLFLGHAFPLDAPLMWERQFKLPRCLILPLGD